MDFAYGGTRYDAGSQMTIYRYTGQRIETGTGLYDYGARWYGSVRKHPNQKALASARAF